MTQYPMVIGTQGKNVSNSDSHIHTDFFLTELVVYVGLPMVVDSI